MRSSRAIAASVEALECRALLSATFGTPTLTPSSTTEGSSVTLSVTASESVTWNVSWGDGSSDMVYYSDSLSISHPYADDPYGPTDTYSISITAMDMT